jgi:hypothetical protein
MLSKKRAQKTSPFTANHALWLYRLCRRISNLDENTHHSNRSSYHFGCLLVKKKAKKRGYFVYDPPGTHVSLDFVGCEQFTQGIGAIRWSGLRAFVAGSNRLRTLSTDSR